MGQIKLAELLWNIMQTAEAEKQATISYMQVWLETASPSFSSSPDQKRAVQRSRENLARDKHHTYHAISIYPLSVSSVLTLLLLSEINFICLPLELNRITKK